MAHSKSQIYIQAVFAVKYRQAMLRPKIQHQLWAYMASLLQEKGQFPIIINGVPDHVHLFFGLSRTASIAEVMKFVKGNSSRFINQQEFLPHRFEWQSGYGAFSYSQSQKNAVIKYIENQEEHHKIQTFEDEYKNMLQKFQIAYEPDELFHEPI